MMREVLLDNRTLGEWFDQKTIAGYIDGHLKGERSFSKRLWPLLCLAIWAEQFKVSP